MRSILSWGAILDHLKGYKPSIIGFGFILSILFLAIFAHEISPSDPIEGRLRDRLFSPTLIYPFGTDELGRDVLSRVLYGARISLFVAFVATFVAMSIGMVVGLLSGYLGGRVDIILMRIVDVTLAFPSLLLAIGISCTLGPSLYALILSLSLVGWASFARVMRGVVASIKEEPFIEAAMCIGFSKMRILVVHILPHTLPVLVVLAILRMSTFILAEGGLSFLGLGVQPPTPSWGGMVAQGVDFNRSAPWMSLFPGGAIAITVMAFNLLGDGLCDLVGIKMEN